MQMNRWQAAFCQWNAERLGIPKEEAVRRYQLSWKTIPGGHGGRLYRKFAVISHDIFQVAFDDSPNEVFQSYTFHAWLHLLRMLVYAPPAWPDSHPIMTRFRAENHVRIVDFGCGLAHKSISLLEALRRSGGDGELFLYDIPTIRLDLLAYIVQDFGLKASFTHCLPEQPVPEFPQCEVIIATEVFEHLHDPMPYLVSMHQALRVGGFLVTGLQEHRKEFMHVTPSLRPLHDRVMSWGYQEISKHSLYQKK